MRPWIVLAILTGLGAVPTFSQQRVDADLAGVVQPSKRARIEALVAKLGSSKAAEREAASLALQECGRSAVTVLREALGHADPEVRRRARHLLSLVLPPLTVDEVVALLEIRASTHEPWKAQIVRSMRYCVEALNARERVATSCVSLDPDELDDLAVWIGTRAKLGYQCAVSAERLAGDRPAWNRYFALCNAVLRHVPIKSRSDSTAKPEALERYRRLISAGIERRFCEYVLARWR